jgi:hypothetical protein
MFGSWYEINEKNEIRVGKGELIRLIRLIRKARGGKIEDF